MDDYATVFKTEEELAQMEDEQGKHFWREDWKSGPEWREATSYLDHDTSLITTPKGEQLSIVSAYGYDG